MDRTWYWAYALRVLNFSKKLTDHSCIAAELPYPGSDMKTLSNRADSAIFVVGK
jgi:hypothetical protein